MGKGHLFCREHAALVPTDVRARFLIAEAEEAALWRAMYEVDGGREWWKNTAYVDAKRATDAARKALRDAVTPLVQPPA